MEYKGMGNFKRTLFIMDEVDGLGAGDRGGVTAMISAAKTTKVPLVLVCNDGKAQKLASLANYCYLINFAPLGSQDLKTRCLRILRAEGCHFDSV